MTGKTVITKQLAQNSKLKTGDVKRLFTSPVGSFAYASFLVTPIKEATTAISQAMQAKIAKVM